MPTINCVTCNTERQVRPYRILAGAKYCSRECSRGTLLKKGNLPWNKGKTFSEETKRKMSENNHMRHTPMTEKQKAALAAGRIKCWTSKRSEESKKRMSLAARGKRTGENNYRWKGGITPENLKIRHSPAYVDWRKAVFNRDNHTCQGCLKRGGWLEAHHIRAFSLFPELRLVVDNGITYCKKCHIANDKHFGRKVKS